MASDRVAIGCYGMTHVGRQRTMNQDHFLIADFKKHLSVEGASFSCPDPQVFGDTMGKMMLVADGMGGANAGEVASQLAISSLVQYLLNSMHWILRPSRQESENLVSELKSAAQFAHSVLCKDVENEPDHRGMGTTLTVAYLVWPMLYVLHVGDSRCYLFRQGRLQQLTDDQTLAQTLLETGYLSREEFESSKYHNVLVSAIGVEGGPQTLIYSRRLKPGDKLMLCSDGLTAHLKDEDIAQWMQRSKTPEEACQGMIDLANERGGRDNSTAIVVNCFQVDEEKGLPG